MENAKTYWDQMDGDIGIALLPPTKENPLRAVEFVSLKDSTVLRSLVQKMIQDANEMMKAMSGNTPARSPSPSTWPPANRASTAESGIDTLSYDLTLGQAFSSMWPKDIPTKLPIEMAWVPGGVIVSVGDSSLTDTLVDRALDGVSSPLSDLPAWKAAYPAPDDRLVDLSHIALFDALRSYLELVDAHTGGRLAANIPAGPGNLESACYMAQGGVMTRVRFSLDSIAAIGQKIMEAREKAQAEQMQQMRAARRNADGIRGRGRIHGRHGNRRVEHGG